MSWINDDSRLFLSRGYLQKGETVEERIEKIALQAEKSLEISGFANKFQDYMYKGYFSLSSPIWSNYGTERGLPISCNGSFFDDDIEDILYKTSEIGMMTKYGAGTSAYFGALRPRGSPISVGGESQGPIHFMELLQTTTDVISQSNIRRGSNAVYLDVEHPDIVDFLETREEGNTIQHLSLGVCISDAWMKSMISGNAAKRKIWLRIIKKRFESGYPYIFWTDTVNNNKPQVYKDKNMKIHASNLCSEIALPSSRYESFVCDLASMNALYYDDWKNTDAPETLFYFLDSVMTEYVNKTSGLRLMETAHNFAKNHRAIGLGVLGWHSYLQSKMIPFESLQAKSINNSMFKDLDAKTMDATRAMADQYGEAPLLEGYRQRNTTRMAIAPTTSSSFILGQVSPSIEALKDNYFTKNVAKGKFSYRNPYLKKLLEEKGKDDFDTWDSILMREGSVQHLNCLNQDEKDVFKTFGELSQMEIIIQAATRQKYIDQSQSLNLMVHPDTPIKDVNQLMISAWEMGVKTLYYQRGTNPAQELARNLLTCSSCEA